MAIATVSAGEKATASKINEIINEVNKRDLLEGITPTTSAGVTNAANAYDGDLATYATGGTGVTDYIQWDLGALTFVKAISFKASVVPDGTYSQFVEVWVSTDGTSWETIYSYAKTSTGEVIKRECVGVAANVRYIRAVMRSGGGTGYSKWFTISVF
ncbi:discoidin domain-containing protein [Candidatus Pyrohabitans sp.]